MAAIARTWLAALIAAVAVVSCGTAVPGSPLPAALACPTRPATPAGSSPAARGAPAVRSGPVVAVICQYSHAMAPSKANGQPVSRIVLRGPAAAGLAAVIAGAIPLPGRARCGLTLPFSQVIRFGYRTRAVTTVTVSYCTIAHAVVTSSGVRRHLAPALSDDLFFYTSMSRGDRGPRTPDLIGLAAPAAVASARRHGFRVLVRAAVLDTGVRFGTVIFQSLPPGAINAGPGNQVEVALAVRPAPPCAAGQLAVGFRYGGEGAGNDFGSLTFRDAGAAPCRLAGRLAVTGTDASGHLVTGTISAVAAPPGILSPHAAAVPKYSPPPAGELAYIWELGAEYRDDPAGPSGLCLPFQVIPARWRVALPGGQLMTVSNAGFITCRGRLYSPGPPAYWTP